MRRRVLSALLYAAAFAACAWLLWGELDAAGVFELSDRHEEAGPRDARAARDADLEDDLRRRAVLRGLPGMRTVPRGTGRLTGQVQRHLPGAGPQALPGVPVRVVAVGGGDGVHREVTTIEDGSFTFDALPALVGYAVVVDLAPFRSVVLRGITVERDRTTDVGTILLGAPTSLTGAVVDAAGRPLPGALVQVFHDRSRPRRFDWRRGLIELQAALEPLAEARAERDGQFHVESLPPGRYVVRVEAPGFATVFREGVWVTADERAPFLQIVLDPGTGYYGRVKDEAGRGIAGARVIAVAVATRRAARLDRVETVSASDGRYRLDRLVAGERYFLEAWAEGHAPAGRFVETKTLEALDLVLAESGRIEGRITDAATGKGVRGAEVTVAAGTANSLSPVSTVTDDDGRYALDHVSPGPILLFAAKAAGYPAGSFDLGRAEGRRVVAGEVTVIDWALEPGRAVYGRVTDQNGRAVPYATVSLADPRRRGEGEETALTAANGAYRVEGLRATAYEVRVTAPGYAPITEEEEGRLEIPETAAEVLHDIVLARGATLTGLVRDPYGAPVAGARTQVTSPTRSIDERLRDLVAVTAATGRWRIAGVPPRVPVVVEADHDAWVKAASSPQRLSPGAEHEVDLTLGAGIHLTGRVTTPSGAPVAGARIRWGPVGPDDERRLRDAFRADTLLTPRVVHTGGDGSFRLDRLPPGRLLLKVEREGFADWYRKDLFLAAEGPRPDLLVELVPGALIEGVVRDARTRRPVAEAWIYAKARRPEEGEATDDGRVRALASAQTAADGTYVLEGLEPGRYEVVVWLALGYVAETQDRRDPSVRRRDVVAPATNVDFALRREGEEAPEGDAR